jgi:outer membrane protein OmpA-like peptidoglycan-associated protein
VDRAERTSPIEQRDALKVPPQGSVVSLTDDLFHSGAAFLRPGSTRSIDPIAEYLRANPERVVRIDSFVPGPNRDVSRGRANEVRDALVRRGVSATRIQTAASERSDRRQESRVDVVISDEKGRLTPP